MNYLVLRYIILLILILTIIVIIKFLKKKKAKINIIIVLCMIGIMVYIYPIENFFIKFNNYTDAFNYYFPNCEIKKVYDLGDYMYIAYQYNYADEDVYLMYFTKESGYKVSNLVTRNGGVTKLYEIGHMSILKIPNSNSFAILAHYSTPNKKDLDVYDSLSSKIDIFHKKLELNFYSNSVIIIFDENMAKKVDNDYTLHMNNRYYNLKDNLLIIK